MTWTKLHDLCGSNTANNPNNSHAIIQRARSVSREEAILVDDRGYTPLHIALVSNDPQPHLEVIRALVRANPNALLEKDVHGDTPMHIALRPNANPKIIWEMLEACPNVAAEKNKEGLMPIHVACRYCPDDEEIIGMLLEANPSALWSRTKMGDLVQKKKQATPSKNHHLILDGTTSSTFRHSKIKTTAEIRFDERSHQLRDGSYPIHMAIANGTPQPILEMLIRVAPNVVSLTDKFGRTCLHLAVTNGATNDTMVTFDTNSSSETHQDKPPITTLEVVELLHSLDTNQIKTPDECHQNLPLHTASMGGCSVDVTKCLVKAYPAAIHRKNKNGMRPLDVAMAFGCCSNDVVYLLELSEKADVEV